VAKQWWDIYVMILILYVALVVPYRLAVEAKDTKGWKIWGYLIDASFLVDIILTFFTSYYDAENSENVYDHKLIAKQYLAGWFWIDSFSILPIEPLLGLAMNKGGAKLNVIAKFPRIARLYSLVRFIRLTKLMRLLKKKKKTQRNLEQKLKLNEGLERLVFFGFFIAISIHIFTCLWIFIANFNKDRSWLTLKQEQIIDQGEKVEGNVQTYFLSLYFVTQTFTTVGYGDVNPSNTLERCFVVVLMLAGVFAFSFASGSLASIM
jgi:CRP-like cAMP-binding protein/MFS family permease